MNGDVSGRDEVPVEEVAGRLGLPVSMLIRRIDAGVLPGRRIQLDDRVAYLVRADSLDVGAEPVEAAVASPAPQSEAQTSSVEESLAEASPYPWRQHQPAAEPPWPGKDAPPPPSPGVEPPGDADDAEVAGEVVDVRLGARVDEAPVRLESETSPRAELAALGLDARELVAALLERWERTLEQRVHAEYRLRYETALSARQAEVKQLQHEIDSIRSQLAVAGAERDAHLATHRTEVATLREQLDSGSGALAERDRLVSDRERAIAARDRVLAEQRREAADRDRRVAELEEQIGQRDVEIEALRAMAKRRRGFFGR
jgi:hypothetical protein